MSNFVKHSIIYSIGNISTKIVGFVLLPLYTTYLTVDEYGIIALLEITTQIIISLFSFNIGTAMMRWSADATNKEEEKSIIFTVITETFVVSIFVFILMYFFSDKLSILFFDSEKFSIYITLLAISSSLGIFNVIPLTLMRQNERSILFTVFTTSKLVVSLFLTIYFVKYLSWGVEGVLWGQIVGQMLFAILSLPMLIANSNLKFSFSKLSDMLVYGFPLVLTGFSVLLLNMSDRYVIKYFQGDAEVGIYSLGHKIASVINMFVIQSFQLGFLPVAYKKATGKDSNSFFVKSLKYYTIILVFSALGISIFSKEIIETFAQNSAYWFAISVVPLLSFSFVLRGIQYQYSISFHLVKKTSYNAIVVVIAATTNIVLNIVLVKEIGFIGAAYAVLISMILVTPLTYILAQKKYYIPYKSLETVFIIALGLAFYGISLFFNDTKLITRISIKAILLFLFPVSLFILRIVTKNEIQLFKK